MSARVVMKHNKTGQEISCSGSVRDSGRGLPPVSDDSLIAAATAAYARDDGANAGDDERYEQGNDDEHHPTLQRGR